MPVDSQDNTEQNKQIVVDNEIDLNNQLIFEKSKYNGSFNIVSTSSTSFTYDIPSPPESTSYTTTNSKLKFDYKVPTYPQDNLNKLKRKNHNLEYVWNVYKNK